jgi:hypothetical protein
MIWETVPSALVKDVDKTFVTDVQIRLWLALQKYN